MGNNHTIIIADKHFLIRHGLKCLLARRPEYRLLGEVAHEKDLLDLLKEKKPDILLIDPHQSPAFSLQTIELVQDLSPSTNFLIISEEREKGAVYRTLETGVDCYLTKECDEAEIEDAITSILNGERFFCKKILNLIWEKSFGKENCDGTPLSQRELEIVKMVTSGKITKEIAQELNLSTHTVYTHRKNIMRKLNLQSTPELVLYAINHGILESTPS